MKNKEQSVWNRLRLVKYPGLSRDIVSFGLVKSVKVKGSAIEVDLQVATTDTSVPGKIEAEVKNVLSEFSDRVKCRVQVTSPKQTVGSLSELQKTPGVRRVIAVASGKGGVGKSTVAANLALALRRQGQKVGLCDCDIYGPSMGAMFGVNEKPTATEDGRIVPVEAAGLKLMSMGFLVGDGSPALLRGPLVTRYVQQFLLNVVWGELDTLVLDLPPGTGDVQLTIVQTISLNGAVIVTTPQEVALIDARKASAMFERVNVPVLGIVENMSCFVCPDNGKRYDLFGSGGGVQEAQRLGVPLLGEIPIDIKTRQAGDEGEPIVLRMPDGEVGKVFEKIAEAIVEEFSRQETETVNLI